MPRLVSTTGERCVSPILTTSKQERLKREYIAANKAGNDEASDDDDDFEDMLNADGKKLKDVLKKVGDLDDESDEDEDYYGKRVCIHFTETITELTTGYSMVAPKRRTKTRRCSLLLAEFKSNARSRKFLHP